ncbi:MAG: trigger factor, partial [Coriobacteriia bacterium]|nr:trigger factor [Coriobacteriia bacterium]
MKHLELKGTMGTLETLSKRTDENKIELTVSMSADEVLKHIDSAYKEAGKVRIPGFRHGKAPRRVLENHYGGKQYFLAQATDEIMSDSLPIAIDQEGLVPLDKPQIKELDLVEEGKDYAYTATFTVRPHLELSSYEPVQIELPSEEPDPEEVEEQIYGMLEYYIDLVDVTDRPVQAQDYVNLELEVTSDNERVEPLTGDNIPYELNRGTMPAAFDRQLIGMSIGEKKEFDFSAEPGEQTWLDSTALSHAVATVREIKAKIRPELTDEWVKEKIEFDSVQDFRDRITDSLRAQKKQELSSLKIRLVSEELASRLQGEVPQILVTLTEQDIYRDFFSSLQRNNQTYDGFLASTGLTPETFRKNTKQQPIKIP